MKKSILKIMFFCILANTLFSCSEEDDSVIPIVVDAKSKYVGKWAGTYTGVVYGEWDATVSQTGQFIGKTIAEDGNFVFLIIGSVSDEGYLNADFYFNNMVIGEFNGELSELSGQGHWTNTAFSLTGIWQGSKSQ